MSDISPLFALEAEELLLAGKAKEAAELCQLGLEVFPDYPAGYIILSKALIEMQDFEQAKEIIASSEDIFPKNPCLSELKELVSDKSKLNEYISNFAKSRDTKELPSEKYIPSELIEVITGDFEVIPQSNFNSDFDSIEEETPKFEENFDFDNIHLIVENEVDLEVTPEVEEKSEKELLSEYLESNTNDPGIDSEELLNGLDCISNDSNFESTEILQSGFLKILANKDFAFGEKGNREIDSSRKDIIPGLFDYQFYDFETKEESLVDIKFISDYDISAIEKKYAKKQTAKDDFALLAEKIKLIEIKPVINNTADESDHIEDYEPEAVTKIAPATETMAKIFVMQKAYDKAIKIFEQLQSENPEKSEFYSEQIETLKEKASQEILT